MGYVEKVIQPHKGPDGKVKVRFGGQMAAFSAKDPTVIPDSSSGGSSSSSSSTGSDAKERGTVAPASSSSSSSSGGGAACLGPLRRER